MKINSSQSLGFVLYSVLIVVLLTSMVAISLLFSMKAGETAMSAGGQNEQAWEAALSGVHYAMKVVQDAPPGWLTWQDNPSEFQQHLLMDDGDEQWYFTVYQKNNVEGEPVRYGLTDEASKLNILHFPSEWLQSSNPSPLMQLISASRRGDSSLTEGSDTNAISFSGGGSGKKGEQGVTLDAVMAASGINSRVLFGKDMDLNLLPDAGTEEVGSVFQNGVGEANLALGLRHLLTTVSFDLNIDSEGRPRIDLNNTNTDLTGLGLPEAVITYIKAMQKEKKTMAHPSDLLGATNTFKGDNGKESVLMSEVKAEELAILLDRCTGTNATQIPGLININTAPKEVLSLLPGVDESIAESIIAARTGLNAEQLRTPAWLIQQGILDADAFKKIARFITARSWQYHFQVIGYSLPSVRYRTLEVIVDMAVQPPKILFIRDLTRMGLPFKVNAMADFSVQQKATGTP